LSKSLEGLLAKNPSGLSVVEKEIIQAYVESHSTNEDSNKLQEELLRLQRTYVEGDQKIASVFSECLILLVPSLINHNHVIYWFQYFVQPAVDSAGHLNRFVKTAREFILAVLNCRLAEDEVENDSTKKTLQEHYTSNSLLYSRFILEIYLEQNLDRWFQIEEKSGIKTQERIRFIKVNAKELLVQFGWKKTDNFLAILNEKILNTDYRMNILSLLSTFVSLQPPYLYQIGDSDLLESLFKCLENDLSSTVLSIAATTLAMTLPHICASVSPLVPRIFSLYGRLCCWRLESTRSRNESLDPLDLNNAQLTEDLDCENPDGEKGEEVDDSLLSEFNTWNKLAYGDHLPDNKQNPTITPLFTFLYGLFPVNFLAFIKSPTEYLTSQNFVYTGMDFWDDYDILVNSKHVMDLHILNPNLVTFTAEQELNDTARWQIYGTPTDIATRCLSFYNQSSFKGQGPLLPNFTLPFSSESGSERQSSKSSTPIVGSVSAAESPTDVPKYVPTEDISANNSILYFEEGEKGRSTKKDRHPRNVFSPSLSTIDDLLQEHTALYSKKEIEKREHDSEVPKISIPPIPEDIDFSRLGPLSAPPIAAPTINLSSAVSSPASKAASAVVTPNIPPISGNSERDIPSRRRSTTLSSPGFIPQPPQQQHISSSQAAVTPLTVTIPYRDSSPVLSKRKDSKENTDIDEFSASKREANTKAIFLEREMLLLKNELDFVSFIEQHSQYRFKKLKEQMNETKINSEEVNHLLSNNKSLRKRIDILFKESEKLQKSTKAFRSERHAYESTLMNKNREYRNQLQDSARKIEELASKVDILDSEKVKLLKSIERQEKLISQYEVQLEDGKESLKSAELRATALESQIRKRNYSITGLTSGIPAATRDCDCEVTETNQTGQNYEERLRKLQEDYKSLQHELRQQEKHYKTQVLELEKLVSQYESKVDTPLTRVSDMITGFKQSSEEQYNQLKLAHEELSDRYIELNHQFRKYVVEQEEKHARIEEGILQKRSLLGYDIKSIPQEEVSPTYENGQTLGQNLSPGQSSGVVNRQRLASGGDILADGNGRASRRAPHHQK
jgi:Hamartin protein